MGIDSISLSFRIGLAFHALNNEGAGGTNVMEPRRLTVGDKEYDGISGEMVRRHVLENFVRLADKLEIPLSRGGRGLLPDRGKTDLIEWMARDNISQLAPEHYGMATEALIDCGVRDIGGFFMAMEKRGGTLKRDSTFEVGWLVTGHPASIDYAQHAAYFPDQQHNLFVQNVRAGLYGGVMRIDAGRVGRNDWYWLNDDTEYPISADRRLSRVEALLSAIEQYLLSPGGARQAGWLQHSGSIDGAILVSAAGPAPFISPIKTEAEADGEGPVISFNQEYRNQLAELAGARTEYRLFEFDDPAGVGSAFDQVRQALHS